MSTTTQGEASTKAPDNVRGVILQCFTLKMYPPSPKNNRMSSTQNYNTPLCACDNLQPPPSTIKKFSPYPSGSEKIQSPLLCPSTKQLLPNTKFLLTSEKITSPNVKLAMAISRHVHMHLDVKLGNHWEHVWTDFIKHGPEI